MRIGLPVLAIFLAARAAAADPVVIVAVSSAETLELADGRRLRLDGMIAPNPADDGDARAADAAADAARAALQAAILGRKATFKPLTQAPDRWGAIPADVERLADGAWLQGLMLGDGHGRVEACPRGGAERLRRLKLAEDEARAARRGLWALPHYRVMNAERPMPARGFAIVEGVAAATGGGGKMRYLNFAANWRDDFTLQAVRAVERRLQRDALGFDGLVGRRVRVRGWVFYNNGPTIEIACSQQIEAAGP